MLAVLIASSALIPITKANENWQSQLAQTLLSHQLANENFELGEKLEIKYIIYQETVKAGLSYSDYKRLVEIARCESRIRHTSSAGTILLGPDKKDAGVFQIRLPVHEAKAQELGLDIGDASGNIRYAVFLYKKSGSIPWNASKHCWNY